MSSDVGIAIAIALALVDHPDVTHPPLELYFTVDEETGLNGAAGLDASMLEGRRLINLDSEEEGSLCVGCAGGACRCVDPFEEVEYDPIGVLLQDVADGDGRLVL